MQRGVWERLFWERVLQLSPVEPLSGGANKDEVDELIASINDSARQANTIILTFLATIVYLAITAGSTTDEQLLLDSPLTLPLFDVGVPAKYFYSIAPSLIVFLHLTLLLQEYFLAYRVYRLPEPVRLSRLAASNTVEADRLFIIPSVIMRLRERHNRPVRFLLRLVFLAVTVVTPIVVLIIIQVKFLPYHDHLTTNRWHRGPIFLDLCLVWFFFLIRPRAASKGLRLRLEAVAFITLLALTVTAAFYSVKIAAIPESCAPSWLDKWTGHRSLRLIDKILVPADPPSALMAVHGEKARGVRLARRDLRCADFAESTLINADFWSSDIRGANFLGADLQGADFSPLGPHNRRRSRPRLAAIGVTNPFPEEEGDPTRLEGANFTQANLRGANFRAAQLAAARLENSDLVAADFSSANLDGAQLAGAFLVGADFKSASLRNTNFRGAQLQGANLSAAKAEYAVFIGASLEAVDLSRVSATGAEFARASLQGAIGLPLAGVDLQQARVARVSFCGKGELQYANLRDLDFVGHPWFDPKVLAIDPAEIPLEVRSRLEKAKEGELCFPKPSPDHVLYARQRPQGWPEPQLDEDSYYEEFSAYLMRHFCFRSDEPVRLAMARRVLERLTVNPEDALAKKLVRLLRQEILAPACNFNFDDHENIKRGILRRIDLLQ